MSVIRATSLFPRELHQEINQMQSDDSGPIIRDAEERRGRRKDVNFRTLSNVSPF